MRYLFSIVFVCLSFNIFCQSPEDNWDKYWDFRNRLLEKFVVYITNPSYNLSGTGIPAGIYNPTTNGYRPRTVSWGDATCTLGEYIATLSTEYEILNRLNSDPSDVLAELKHTIEAFLRLDYASDAFFGCSAPTNPNDYYDGFFIRDDVYSNFLNYWYTRGYSAFNSSLVQHVKSDYLHSGNEMSQDQVWNLFMGWALVLKFVKETSPMDFSNEVVEIIDRHMESLHDYDLYTPIYRIINPCTGEVANASGFYDLLPFAYFLRMAAEWITDSPGDYIYGYPDQTPFVFPMPVTPFYNDYGRTLLTAIAGTYYNQDMDQSIKNIFDLGWGYNQFVPNKTLDIDKFCFEHIPLLYYVLHGDKTDHPAFDFYFSYIEELLNFATISNLQYYGEPDHSSEWLGNFLRTPVSQFLAKGNIEYLYGEYNGLSFMLLHNLFLLTYLDYYNENRQINYNFPYEYEDYPYEGIEFLIGSNNTSTFTTINSLKNIEVSSTINSGGRVKFTGKNITLLPGFKVKLGAEFIAEPNDWVAFFEDISQSAKKSIGTNCNYIGANTFKPIISSIIEPIESEIKIYPNPVRSKLFIQLPNENNEFINFTFELFNVNGNKMIKNEFNNCDSDLFINTSQLSTGIYHYILKSDDMLKNGTFIKIHD